MALLLNIETATPAGSVCLSQDGKILSEKISTHQKDHAAVIAPFIMEVMQETGIKSSQIDAIAISGGPGSYTGLRVASSTAKGLCYAWDIPLVAISTLKMMANGMRFGYAHPPGGNVQNRRPVGERSRTHRSRTLFCPMIDARRMEVFTALYDWDLNECMAPQAVILKEDFLSEYKEQKIVFAGTGQPKAAEILGKIKAWSFSPYESRASHLVYLAEQAFNQKQFADTAYFEPFYLKSVYLPKKK